MKKTRYTEEQIAFALKQAETGTRVEEVCRKIGISEATFYNWKSKYGGIEAADIKWLKEPEDEIVRLKKLFAEVSLENNAMKELFAKKSW